MLRYENVPMKCADLGTPNAIPDVRGLPRSNPPHARVDPGMPAEEGAWVGQGHVHTMLPYTMLDGYDRDLKPSSLRMAVLENEFLRAEFAVDLGGRLWGLYSKTEGRELLFRNDVFQPANLALRNAWFSGGVEWNCGIIGHHAHTASPLFAAHYANRAGGETLKMWEYERKRGLVFIVRATLCRDVLLVRVTVENPHEGSTYVYWWSNMAVEQHETTRIVVPATHYYTYGSGKDGMPEAHRTPVPDYGYFPARHGYAYDYFFQIPEDRQKFEAAVESDGRGFVQFSTPNLIGRKLFVWGTESQGGRTWNRWLSHDDRYYAETQAGLLHSQMEHRPMAGKSSFEWTEGYAALSGDPDLLCRADIRQASAYTENILTLGGRFDLVNDADAYFDPADGAEEILDSCGSGWGALTEKALGHPLSENASFPAASIREDSPEADFLTLCETGSLPAKSPVLTEGYPIDYFGGAMGGAFLEKLENAPHKGWYEWLELGCFYYEAGSVDAAEAALKKSLADRKTPLALAALARLKAARGHGAEGVGLMKEAVARMEEDGGEYVRLVIAAADFIKAHGDPAEAEEIIRAAVEKRPAYLENGRIALLYIQILVRQGGDEQLEKAEEILVKVPEVADMREGEVSTSAVWIELYRAIMAKETGKDPGEIPVDEVLKAHPVPAGIDFRMSGYQPH
ncbi:MAG: DUF5107 domain-containing protein [Clostridia bacterium]|nr:DUF5107 domain-containing protein [Clostridia bacterium]